MPPIQSTNVLRQGQGLAQALLQQMQLRVQEHEAPFEPAGTLALAQYATYAAIAPRSLVGSYRRPAAAPVPPTAGVPA